MVSKVLKNMETLKENQSVGLAFFSTAALLSTSPGQSEWLSNVLAFTKVFMGWLMLK